MSEPNTSGFSDNTVGALAYITVVPAIAFLILVPYRKSFYVRFHAWQSVFLSFVWLLVSAALNYLLPFLGMSGVFLAVPITWVIAIIMVLLWALCAILALNGKLFKLPVLGKLAETQAKG
jgi:uncharacterized membrane protein